MTKFYGDLMFSTGEYTNKDGETKKRWSKAGAVFNNNGKLSIKFEAMPADPNWSGWMSIFPDNRNSQQSQKDVVPIDVDDKPIDLTEIPFN